MSRKAPAILMKFFEEELRKYRDDSVAYVNTTRVLRLLEPSSVVVPKIICNNK